MKTYNEYIKENIDWDQKLISSSIKDDLNGVKKSIENGADIHVRHDMSLRYASENGHLEVVKYLIENGANIHTINDYCIRVAIHSGHLNTVKYLVSIYIERKKFKELLNHFDILPEEIKEELKLSHPWFFAAKDHGLI